MDIHQIIANDLLYEVESLAPYSVASTEKALSFVELPKRNRDINIVNIGSGTGYQSVTLQDTLKKNIYTIDHRPQYIKQFQDELSRQQLDKYIHAKYSPLQYLPFKENEIDLIWTESTAKDIKFEEGLSSWNKYLAHNGYLGICAYCWDSEKKPKEVITFFEKNNIDNDSIPNRISQMTKHGFAPIAHFSMPDECWWNYFCPLDIHRDHILEKYCDNMDVVNIMDDLDEEITLFEKYGDSYKYVFFIGKKL